MILDKILAHKHIEVVERRSAISIESLRDQAEQKSPTLDFVSALRLTTHQPALIAECKKTSPSKGLLRADYDPAKLAMLYAANGAAAVSVLTDEFFFQGSLLDLATVRSASTLPILRKDFVIDGYQVYEARAAGADAILLIVAALDLTRLKNFHALATDLGLSVLVEVHNESELETAMQVDPKMIGINNRNLHDFSVDLQTTARLRPSIPNNIVVVAESGLHSSADVECVAAMGVDAILVGEALITAQDIGTKVREMAGIPSAVVARRP
jgi:indole-3-glycerol phosphate synthase